jgi:hypothetical protein
MKTTINHVNKIICFSKVRTGTISQFTWCYFGHIGVFEIILVILGVRYYFGHYGVSRVILVILEFSRLFWLF